MKKEKLLYLLQSDNEIINAIKSIFCTKKDDTNEENKTDELLVKIENQKVEIETLQKENKILFKQNTVYREKIEFELKELLEKEKELDFYRSNFENELRAYDLYQELQQNTKESLRGIFKSDSFVGFLTCGVQQNNIESLWEYIKNELRDRNNKDIETLISIFYFLFDKLSLAYPYYKLQDIIENQNFDTEYHIRHNSSQNQSGKIVEVLFRGYENSNTNKIIKQSIVKI